MSFLKLWEGESEKNGRLKQNLDVKGGDRIEYKCQWSAIVEITDNKMGKGVGKMQNGINNFIYSFIIA